MNKEMFDCFINVEIEKLIKNGSNIEDIKKLKPEFEKLYFLLDIDSPKRVMSILSDEIVEESKKFMNSTNENKEKFVDGLSTCIYLPDYKTGVYKMTFLGGKNNKDEAIDEDTRFDIASVTKMFTLLLTFKLVEHGYLSLDDKIADLDDRFTGLEDFTVNDLLKLCGTLYTKGNPKEGKNIEEANQILQTVFIKDKDRTRNLYTDLGGIVLSKVMEKIVSKAEGKEVSYSDLMNKYIIEPCGLQKTGFNPKTLNLAGNGNKLGLVHDPKARALGGAVGSAGIFTTSDDLAKIAKGMFMVDYVNYDKIKNLVSKENLIKMGTVTFPDAKQNNKGLLGMYQKNADRDNKWLAPLAYGDHVFTAQGFTGAAAIFDNTNKIHNNFLVNSIKDEAPKKPDGFINQFKDYEYYIVGKTMQMYIIKEYYGLLLSNNNYVDNIKIK